MKAVILALFVLSAAVMAADSKFDWTGSWKVTDTTAADKCCYPASGFTFTAVTMTPEELATNLANVKASATVKTNDFGLDLANGIKGAANAMLAVDYVTMKGKFDTSAACKAIQADGKDFEAAAGGKNLLGVVVLAGTFKNYGTLALMPLSFAKTPDDKALKIAYTSSLAADAVQCTANVVKTGMSWVWIIIIILVILAIIAVVGFLLYKRQQANKLSSNLGAHEYARA